MHLLFYFFPYLLRNNWIAWHVDVDTDRKPRTLLANFHNSGKILAWLNCLKTFWQRERSSVKKVYIETESGISADSMSDVILKTYTYFPDLFTRNYTWAKVFAIVRQTQPSCHSSPKTQVSMKTL